MVPGTCSFWVLVCSVLDDYSASDWWAKYCDEHVCLCVCVCLSAMISWELHVWSSPNFWHMLPMAVARFSWQRSDTLCTSGFMDGVIFAHKLRLLDVATRLRQWGLHADSGLDVGIPAAGSRRSRLLLLRPQWACSTFMTSCLHIMSLRISRREILQAATPGAESAVCECFA